MPLKTKSNYIPSVRDTLYIQRHREVESKSMGKNILGK